MNTITITTLQRGGDVIVLDPVHVAKFRPEVLQTWTFEAGRDVTAGSQAKTASEAQSLLLELAGVQTIYPELRQEDRADAARKTADPTIRRTAYQAAFAHVHAGRITGPGVEMEKPTTKQVLALPPAVLASYVSQADGSRPLSAGDLKEFMTEEGYAAFTAEQTVNSEGEASTD